MSFGTYARKVRDPSLPYARRISALRGCVGFYRPLGYEATLAYLGHVAGPWREDETALLRALDVLSASRRLWLAEVRSYAQRRKRAKRLGSRSPRPGDPNPAFPPRWYGDARAAALFALSFLLRKLELHRPVGAADPDVLRLARRCLETGGDLGPAGRDDWRRLLVRCERLREASGWPHLDWPGLALARDSLRFLHEIANAGLFAPTGSEAAESEGVW